MFWITKEWVFEVMTGKRQVEFSNLRKYELIQILNILRLAWFEQINERLLRDE